VIAAIIILEKILKTSELIVNEYEISSCENKTLFILDPNEEFSPEMPLTLLDSINGFVYLDGIPFMHTNLSKGLFVLFMSYFAFGLDYERDVKNLMLCLEKWIMKWPFSKSDDPKEVLNIGQKLTYFV